jgi:hypothetical protein
VGARYSLPERLKILPAQAEAATQHADAAAVLDVAAGALVAELHGRLNATAVPLKSVSQLVLHRGSRSDHDKSFGDQCDATHIECFTRMSGNGDGDFPMVLGVRPGYGGSVEEEEPVTTKYIACKHRNVAAAYERFLGPTAAALPEPWHSRTWNGLVNILKRRYSHRRPADPSQS